MDQDPNPFLIETVLKILFNQMTVSNLTQARLVSSLWNQMALDQLQLNKNSIKKVKINDYFILQKFTCELQNPQLFTRFKLDLRFYTQKLYKNANPELNILDNFHISQLTLNSSDLFSLGSNEMLEILSKISKTLKNFKIKNINGGPTSSENENFVNFPKLPRLEKFRFETCHMNGESYFKFIQGILNNCENLSAGKLDCFPARQDICDGLLSTKYFTKIIKLHVDIWIFLASYYDLPDEIEFHQNLTHLHLKELKIARLSGCKENEEILISLNQFLKSQSESLENFSCNLNDFSLHAKIQFPVFSKLQNLSLEINRDFEKDIKWTNTLEVFNFNDKFPNLNHFEVNDLGQFQEILIEGLGNLKSLKILHSNWFHFPRIFKLFPNIENFECDFTQFEKYGREIPWIRLKKLTIRFESIDQIEIVKLEQLKGLKCLILQVYINPTHDFKFFEGRFDKIFKTFESLNFIKLIHLSIFRLNYVQIQEFEKFFNNNTKNVTISYH